MNILGIIAEYNPFHQGHAYQIKTLKKTCQADYAVIAMSGNFVQRGAPALMEKYSRANMALNCGADLVLELPALFATASAETFARGGVSLLQNTGIVTHLGFGAETDDIRLLSEIAAVLSEQPWIYQKCLRRELKKGCSFPSARAKALLSYPGLDVSDSSLAELLKSPNNILALEYLKALTENASDLIPVPLLRRGSGYHDARLAGAFCSASAIRSHLKKGSSPLPETAMPKAAYEILRDYTHPFLYKDDFSSVLHYELLTEDAGRFGLWEGSSPELTCRLEEEREHFTDWSGFCQRMKTKNITYTRLSRLFVHMLLHITQEDCRILAEPSYLRILGFRQSAAPLLTALKAKSRLPVVTRPANACRTLPLHAQKLLAFDFRSTDLYRLGLTGKGDCSLKNDYQQPILRV